MKHLYILLMCFFSLHVSAQQSFTDEIKYLATYQFTYQPDSTDVQSVRTEEMLLYLGGESSKFSSAGKAMMDNILTNRNKSNRSAAEFSRLQMQIPPTSLHYYIFKLYSSKEMSFIESVARDKFRYEQNLNQFDWEIEEGIKKIYGYQVQKATTKFAGRDYIAWFTPEIPISDGPYKFNGLPGLILKVRDTEDHYVFELTQFERVEEPEDIEFDSKTFLTTTKEKFLQVKKEYHQDPIAAVERSGITFGFKPGQREKMQRDHQKQLRKQNNPLELE